MLNNLKEYIRKNLTVEQSELLDKEMKSLYSAGLLSNDKSGLMHTKDYRKDSWLSKIQKYSPSCTMEDLFPENTISNTKRHKLQKA